MTLLKKSDLTSANNSGSKLISSLIADQDDSQAMINAIQEFISSSTEHLKGEAYDAVRTHLESYIPILQTRIKVANSIIDSIKSANNSMVDYMEDEDVLNTDDLDSLTSKYNSYMSTAREKLSKVNTYDNRADNQRALNDYEYYAGLARQVNKKIQLLENLSSKDNAVYSSLSGIESEITAFKNAVGDINTIKFTIN